MDLREVGFGLLAVLITVVIIVHNVANQIVPQQPGLQQLNLTEAALQSVTPQAAALRDVALHEAALQGLFPLDMPLSIEFANYSDLLAKIQSFPPETIEAELNTYIEELLRAQLGLVQTRPLLDEYVNALRSLEVPSSDEIKIAAGAHAIELIQAQSSSFEDQNGAIRDIMASAYEAMEDFDAAAKILSQINTDTSTRKYSNEELVALWIRITRLYLEVDDTTAAEAWLNKAKNLMYTISNKELLVHFKLSQARVQDARREFMLCAQGYFDISFDNFISEDERSHTLAMAIKCAVLAPAGPDRTRMLGRLYKDERSCDLQEHGILEKVFFDRIISAEEASTFAQGLMPHQLATTSDGTTVLARAITEHNLLATSHLYANISFDMLGSLLGMSADKAEEITARMIEQGRLVGSLDQVQQQIYFEDQEATGETGSKKADGGIGKQLRRFDANIQSVAEEVEKVTSLLQATYPNFTAQATAARAASQVVA